jgi:hypothetical protein
LLVLAKIEELADAQLEHEELTDKVARALRRKELVTQLHDVVAQMTDRMIARLNSNSFIRVHLPLSHKLSAVCGLFCRSSDGLGV